MADMIEVVCERDAPLDLGIVVLVYGGRTLLTSVCGMTFLKKDLKKRVKYVW